MKTSTATFLALASAMAVSAAPTNYRQRAVDADDSSSLMTTTSERSIAENVPVPAQGTLIVLALPDNQERDFDEGDMERRRFNLKKALRTAFHVADEATEVIFRRDDENAHGQDTALLLAIPAARRRDTVGSEFRERAGAANEGSTANIILAIPDSPRKRDGNELQIHGLRLIQLLDIA
ncbi:hypothetical protein A4X13_0g6444 [Tilletia indica]|uniref:Uncharacterized protein n=1 Tax=Tilletia indica TaxID=43049 RepID=A0A177TKK8_9BASI|nr:hypothetical protein A4X13_0g6444 [Tilletia indica]